jgi:hypothetical protein
MLLLPFVSVVAAYAIHAYFSLRVAVVVTSITMGLLAMSTVDLIRADFVAAGSYDRNVILVKDVLNRLGDTNGDNKITVMTQDPFILNYHGFYAVMIPSDPLDMILEAAERYDVDYLLMPPARVSLDPIYQRTTTDPRLTFLEAVEGTTFEVWGISSQ